MSGSIMSVVKARHNVWVNHKNALPANYIYIQFNNQLSCEERIWFNDLLIAGLYPMFDEIKKFAEILIGWNDPNNCEKLAMVLDIFHKRGKWELKEAFNYMLLGDVPPMLPPFKAPNRYFIQLLDSEREQEKITFISPLYAHFGRYHARDKFRMILTNEVERKAIKDGSYKFILYAFYVYRTYRYWIDTSVPIGALDFQVRNYFFNIAVPDNIEGSLFKKLTAQELFFRNIKQYIKKLYSQDLAKSSQPTESEWYRLIRALQTRRAYYMVREGGDADAGQGILLKQPLRGGEGDGWQNKVTPFQFLLGEICNTLRPNCVEALLDFKRYLLNIPSFCQSAINIGLENWGEIIDMSRQHYRRTGIYLSYLQVLIDAHLVTDPRKIEE